LRWATGLAVHRLLLWDLPQINDVHLRAQGLRVLFGFAVYLWAARAQWAATGVIEQQALQALAVPLSLPT
jgi:hypothetical protein